MEIVQIKIKLIPYEGFQPFMKEAEQISPDTKDTEYLALAMKLKCAVWSNDKKLKTQDKVKIYSTEDLKKEFNK